MLLMANGLVALAAVLHLYFLVLEMFLWTRPLGRKTFGLTEAFAHESRALAANQGHYNGFLVVGLVWGLWLGVTGLPQKVFFLGCVIVAGLFGGSMVSKRIVVVQAVPAAMAQVLVLATY